MATGVLPTALGAFMAMTRSGVRRGHGAGPGVPPGPGVRHGTGVGVRHGRGAGVHRGVGVHPGHGAGAEAGIHRHVLLTELPVVQVSGLTILAVRECRIQVSVL